MGCAASAPRAVVEVIDEELFTSYTYAPKRNAVSVHHSGKHNAPEQALRRHPKEEATSESTHSETSENGKPEQQGESGKPSDTLVTKPIETYKKTNENLISRSTEKNVSKKYRGIKESSPNVPVATSQHSTHEDNNTRHVIGEIAFDQFHNSDDGLSDDEVTMTSWEMTKYSKERESAIAEKNREVKSENQSQSSDEVKHADENTIVSSSEESDTDWDSVESSSGSEGDGLKRGMKKQKTKKISSRRQFLISQMSSLSDDESDVDPNFFATKSPSDDRSEESIDQNDIFKPKPSDKKTKKVEKREAIHNAVPLPTTLSPKKNKQDPPVYDHAVFDALVEQLDASMSSLSNDNEGVKEKPGPPKSPGNTSHEKAYRQNFNGNTLKNSQQPSAYISLDDNDDAEPDFFEEDDCSVQNQKEKELVDLNNSTGEHFMDNSADLSTLLNDFRQTSPAPTTTAPVVTPNYISPVSRTLNPVKKSDVVETKGDQQNANDDTPKMNNRFANKTSAYKSPKKTPPKRQEVSKVQNIPVLDNSVSYLIEIDHSDSDSERSMLNDAALGRTAIGDCKETKTHVSPEVELMRQAINLDPWEDDNGFCEESFLNVLAQYPNCCQRTYELEAFDAQLYPLSAVCAFGASLEVVEKCYHSSPQSIKINDKSVGTPLHYACSFDASDDVVSFLLQQNPQATKETDEFGRTPLHAAALFNADVSVIKLLLEAFPDAALQSDEDGMTPLHLAIEAEDNIDVNVLDALLKANPKATNVQSLADAVTPLMLAVARCCSADIMKLLIKVNKQSLQIKDKVGRIPLHVAAALKADVKILKLLVKNYPEGKSVKDNAGETPMDLGKRVKIKKDALIELQ